MLMDTATQGELPTNQPSVFDSIRTVQAPVEDVSTDRKRGTNPAKACTTGGRDPTAPRATRYVIGKRRRPERTGVPAPAGGQVNNSSSTVIGMLSRGGLELGENTRGGSANDTSAKCGTETDHNGENVTYDRTHSRMRATAQQSSSPEWNVHQGSSGSPAGSQLEDTNEWVDDDRGIEQSSPGWHVTTNGRTTHNAGALYDSNKNSDAAEVAQNVEPSAGTQLEACKIEGTITGHILVLCVFVTVLAWWGAILFQLYVVRLD